MRVTSQMVNESAQRAGIQGIGSSSIGTNALLKSAAGKGKSGSSLLKALKKNDNSTAGFDNYGVRNAADILERKAEALSKDDKNEEAERVKKIADKLTESISGSYGSDCCSGSRYSEERFS